MYIRIFSQDPQHKFHLVKQDPYEGEQVEQLLKHLFKQRSSGIHAAVICTGGEDVSISVEFLQKALDSSLGIQASPLNWADQGAFSVPGNFCGVKDHTQTSDCEGALSEVFKALCNCVKRVYADLDSKAWETFSGAVAYILEIGQPQMLFNSQQMSALAQSSAKCCSKVGLYLLFILPAAAREIFCNADLCFPEELECVALQESIAEIVKAYQDEKESLIKAQAEREEETTRRIKAEKELEKEREQSRNKEQRWKEEKSRYDQKIQEISQDKEDLYKKLEAEKRFHERITAVMKDFDKETSTESLSHYYQISEVSSQPLDRQVPPPKKETRLHTELLQEERPNHGKSEYSQKCGIDHADSAVVPHEENSEGKRGQKGLDRNDWKPAERQEYEAER